MKYKEVKNKIVGSFVFLTGIGAAVVISNSENIFFGLVIGFWIGAMGVIIFNSK
jgi:hypothetical protein